MCGAALLARCTSPCFPENKAVAAKKIGIVLNSCNITVRISEAFCLRRVRICLSKSEIYLGNMKEVVEMSLIYNRHNN